MTETIDLLCDLIRIQSVNPNLHSQGSGESAIADFIANWFQQAGFEVHRLEEVKGRPSVVAVARGTKPNRSLMLNGHMDTVGLNPFQGDPLVPWIDGKRLVGRGAFDMKSGLAAMMVAARKLKRSELFGDLYVSCVSDEEHGSLGTEEVLRHFRTDAAIVTEPTALQLTVAHKGFAWFELLVHGKSAHGSRPDLGVDAIVKAGKFLAALERYQQRLTSIPPHPLLGHASVHASLITGGQEWSSYPEWCRLSIERRTLPGESIDSILIELREILSGIQQSDPLFRFELLCKLVREPLEIDTQEELVRIASAQLQSKLGCPAVLRGETFWTDAALFHASGIPAFLLGVVGGGAHSAYEYVDIESVDVLMDLLYNIAKDYLGVKSQRPDR
jgi:acetylornithine deacetylase